MLSVNSSVFSQVALGACPQILDRKILTMKRLGRSLQTFVIFSFLIPMPNAAFANVVPDCIAASATFFQCVKDIAARWPRIEMEEIETKLGVRLTESTRVESKTGKVFQSKTERFSLEIVLTDSNKRPGLTVTILSLDLSTKVQEGGLCMTRTDVVDAFGKDYKVLAMPRYHSSRRTRDSAETLRESTNSIENFWGLTYEFERLQTPSPLLFLSFGNLHCLGNVTLQSSVK